MLAGQSAARARRGRAVLRGGALLALPLLASACRAPAPAVGPVADPSAGEVRLPAAGGFDAYLVLRGDAGIWRVACLPVFERYGCPEIVALDDRGRCTVLVSYSGKWTPLLAVHDGQWLAAVALADVDPRRPGPELYVGGKRGNLYQVCPQPQGGFDSRIIAYWPGREIHTLVAADLDRTRPGIELIAFTRPGALYLIEPNEEPDGSFRSRRLQELPGRVRDAAVLRDADGRMLGVATVSRSGEAALLSLEAGKPAWRTLYRTGMGLGRIAVRRPAAGEPTVLYVSCDDGRIVRLEEQPDGSFAPQLIYAGPQGPRGLVAGRFCADPGIESVAVFGYSKRVVLLSRHGDRWQAETIFEDLDKGHWLAVGELDGRNPTDEIVLSGYGARVVLLTRPPGYGLPRSVALECAQRGDRSCLSRAKGRRRMEDD